MSPCDCSGSLKYTHLKCLSQWAKEKRSLCCELCKAEWGSEVRSHLSAVIADANLQNQQRHHDRIIRLPYEVRLGEGGFGLP